MFFLSEDGSRILMGNAYYTYMRLKARLRNFITAFINKKSIIKNRKNKEKSIIKLI